MRGQVYGLRPPRTARGHEQQGRRYAVVVQATRFDHLGTWLAVPTSTSARPSSYRPAIEVPGRGPTLALCEALTSIDPQQRLTEVVGALTYAEMDEVDAALRLLMDLDLPT